MKRIAGATYEGTGAVLCAAFIKLSEDCEAGCVFDREGSAEDVSHLYQERLQEWLEAPTTTAPQELSDRENFVLRDEIHQVEYAAPLRFGGRTKGALVVAFDRREDLGETESRLIEAAAQQAALAAHISSSIRPLENIEDPRAGGRSAQCGS